MQFKLYHRAHQQLLDIWHYTAVEWGEAQADTYIDGLYDSLQRLETPSTWRKIKDNRFVGVYFLRYQRHFIFFKKLSDHQVGIISILHKRMHIPDRLLEED